jgi:hypothetical protein
VSQAASRLVKLAYGLSGHRSLTERALKELKHEQGIKLTRPQRERLIHANLGTDLENLKTLMVSADKSPFHYHHGEETKAKELIEQHLHHAVEAKNTDQALDALGIALHTAQDRYAHSEHQIPHGIKGLWAHMPWGPRADNPSRWPEKADKAVADTKTLISAFVAQGGPLDRVTDAPLHYHARMEKDAQVAPYQQLTQWTCSAACLRAVLLHWGQDWPESILVPLIGARPKRGAETTEIAEAARMLGFQAFEYSFDSVEHAKVLLDQELPVICDIKSFEYTQSSVARAKSLLDQNIPIICDIQSFKKPGSGHYVVMTGIDEEGVHLMDPNVPELENQRTISIEEMEGRWWDLAMAPPHQLMNHWGVIVIPGE